MSRQQQVLYYLNDKDNYQINCISLLTSKLNIDIKLISINKSAKIFESKKLNEIIKTNKFPISFLDNNKFNNKFFQKHSQGIVIDFSYDFYSDIFLKNISLKTNVF